MHSSNNGNDDEDGLSSPEHQEVNSDVEQSYERKPRKRVHWDHAKSNTIPRLPIKLPDGRVVETAGRIVTHVESESEDEAGSSSEEQPQTHLVEDVSTGARFGRPAVVDVIGTSSRQTRIQLAKEQIAGICQDILADPESSVRLCICSQMLYDSHAEIARTAATSSYIFPCPNNFPPDSSASSE